MSHQYWPEQPGARQIYGKNTVTLVSEEHTFGAKEIVVRKFEISDDKVRGVCVCVCVCSVPVHVCVCSVCVQLCDSVHVPCVCCDVLCVC